MMVGGIFNLVTVGGASVVLETLQVLSRHADGEELRKMSAEAARRILWTIPAAFAALKASAFLQAISKRVGGMSVSEVLKKSNEPFLLYLRPFDLDDVLLPPPRLSHWSRIFAFWPLPVRIEEELFDVADGYRPLIAVGKPSDRRNAARGVAYRSYLEDGQWQGYVADKIRRADRVVVVCTRTKGVRWEIDRILQEKAHDKTLFLFHPNAKAADEWSSTECELVSALVQARLVPEPFRFQSRPIGFFFAGESLMEIVNSNWSATSYRTAFSYFLSYGQKTHAASR